jgi:hypothetical protein
MKVRRVKRNSAQETRLCVNCGCSLPADRADCDAVAWYWHCRPCSQLAAEELDLSVDQPEGAPIRIYQCRSCGTQRSCRPGWLTRCPVCLGERSHGPLITDAAQRLRAMQAGDTALQLQTGLLSAASGHDTDQATVEARRSCWPLQFAVPSGPAGTSWPPTCTACRGPAPRLPAPRTEPGQATKPAEQSPRCTPAPSTAQPAAQPRAHELT